MTYIIIFSETLIGKKITKRKLKKLENSDYWESGLALGKVNFVQYFTLKLLHEGMTKLNLNRCLKRDTLLMLRLKYYKYDSNVI